MPPEPARAQLEKHGHGAERRQLRTVLQGAPLLYRGTSLTRNSFLLGPYSRTMPRALRWSQGGGLLRTVLLAPGGRVSGSVRKRTLAVHTDRKK